MKILGINKRTLLLTVIIIVLFAVFFNLSINSSIAVADSVSDDFKPITVCVSMEKFTLGQGYIIEPTLVKINDQTRASVVITDLLKGKYPDVDQPCVMTGSLDDAFYLSSVYDPSHGTPVFPEYITKKADLNPYGGKTDWLGEFDYYKMSGWMYCVDNKFPNVGAAEWLLSDGEVMRWQFTLYGYGSDLGADNSEWGAEDITNVGNKDELTWAVALCSSVYADSILKYTQSYQNAMSVLQDLEAGQEKIDETLNELVENGPRFPDVSKDAWYRQSVDYVIENQLLNGTTKSTFSPGDTLTRAMAVTVLYRMAGEPKLMSSATTYSDVDIDDWYGMAVTWLAENGMAEGLTGNAFVPDRIITREELAYLIYRYAIFSGADVNSLGDLSGFLDSEDISQKYSEALIWAVEEGILQGTDDNFLMPSDYLTRAQFAAIIMRFSIIEN